MVFKEVVIPFDPNIPQPTDLLQDSQGEFLSNNQQLDASFLIDHYTFSDVTGQTGKHKQVTNPDQVTHPTVIQDEPKIYGVKQAGSTLPTIQFSRYFDTTTAAPAVPTPLTSLQSNGAVTSTISVFDFAGLTLAMAMLYAFTGASKTVYFVWWDGVTLRVNQISSGTSLTVSALGSVLQITTGANVYWTLEFKRLQ